ncbi:hypothetical protein [Parendozoicomonas haliclonae]|uniref:TRAF-type zinc finger n=1 Tax=Parendozoicomonas haliclonae TaxID=1960125 RepID=A0A1X7AKU1_9GAMM|nr:hypothetical protein [Parendozoicomonas haliclonae]SMA48353.1 hypothetical protein EHSB41UT_02708 [Parendozoicomonas haliclonae]
MTKTIKGFMPAGSHCLFIMKCLAVCMAVVCFSSYVLAGSKGLPFDQQLGIYRYDLDRLTAITPHEAGKQVAPVGVCALCKDIPAAAPLHCSSCTAYACKKCLADYIQYNIGRLTCPQCSRKIVSATTKSNGLAQEASSSETGDIDFYRKAPEESLEPQEVRYNLVDGWDKSLGAIDVLCDNEGCHWTVVYGEGEGAEAYQQHKDECEYQDVDCPQGCGAQVVKNSLDLHKEVCSKSVLNCPECDQALSRDELEQHKNSNSCKVQKAAYLLGQMSLESSDSQRVMKELLAVQNELAASMHNQIQALEAERSSLVAKVEAQSRQLHFSSSLTSLEGWQFVTVNLLGEPGASFPTMRKVYYSEPFTVAGNIHGQARLVIAVIYHGSARFGHGSPETADVYLLGEQALLNRVRDQQETVEVDLVFLSPIDAQESSPTSSIFHLTSAGYRRTANAPNTELISKPGFHPLSYGSHASYRKWLMADEHIKSRAASIFVRNSRGGSHRLDHLSLTPAAGLVSRYQSSPVTVFDSELHILIAHKDIFAGGYITYPLLIGERKYVLYVGRLSDTHLQIRFNRANGVERAQRTSQNAIFGTMLITGIQNGVLSKESVHTWDLETEHMTIAKRSGEYSASQVVLSFAKSLNEAAPRLTLSDIPEEERPLSVAHQNTNIQLKSMLLQQKGELQQQGEMYDRRLNRRDQQLQLFLRTMARNQTLSFGVAQVSREAQSIIWTIPEMQLCMESQLQRFNTKSVRLGNMEYWLKFIREDDGVYGMYLRAKPKGWHSDGQPSSFNKINFTFQNTGAEWTMDVGHSRLFRDSAVWRGIVDTGHGWSRFISVSTGDGLMETNADGQLTVKVQFIQERAAAGRRRLSSGVVEDERRPLMTN